MATMTPINFMLGKYRAVIAAARRSFSFASDVVVVVSLLVELLPLATTPFLLGPVALWSIEDKSDDESVESCRPKPTPPDASSSSAVATPRATTNRTSSGRRARNVIALLFFPERFWDCVAIKEALIKVLFVLVVFVLLTDFDAIIEKGGDDDALVVVVLVEDKDPTIVVIVFFLSVFFFQSALLLQRVTLTSLFSFFNSMRYTKKSGGFFLDGWDASLSLFFILDFFCVCVILKP
jgi:hypothetical protein